MSTVGGKGPDGHRAGLSQADYERLLGVRTALRRFLRWSESQAGLVGLTAMQHQLLLAIKGHPDQRGPTIGDLAEYLCTRPHTVVGLVDRAALAGLVARKADGADARIVRVHLTGDGDGKVSALAAIHLEELQRLVPLLAHLTGAPDAP